MPNTKLHSLGNDDVSLRASERKFKAVVIINNTRYQIGDEVTYLGFAMLCCDEYVGTGNPVQIFNDGGLEQILENGLIKGNENGSDDDDEPWHRNEPPLILPPIFVILKKNLCAKETPAINATEIQDNSFLDINNSRTDEQRIAMQRIIENGYDPFLKENILKEHKNPILKEGKYWFVTENQWPYNNIRKQFLFITQMYVETLSELNGEAFQELLLLANEICNEYGIKGGALCGRFGDTKISGATVKHLHFQVIESDPEKGHVLFCIGAFKK